MGRQKVTNFHPYIDGSIVLVYLGITIGIGWWLSRYVKNVQQYLLAGRNLNLYLGIASLSATEFGIATSMANAELGYKFGFVGIIPGIALALAMLIVGWTGFCIQPMRASGVMTVPEFFEKQFGPRIRQAAGIVIVLGGLLNMGVFLRQAGDFLTVLVGLDVSWLEWLMTGILLIVAVYTLLGGMLSVLLTDYVQFVFMSIGLLGVSFFVLDQIGWDTLVNYLESQKGPGALQPFAERGYPLERLMLDVLVALAVVLTWQTIITRVLAAKDVGTGRRIFMYTSPFFIVRFFLPAFLGVAAFYYLPSVGIEVESAISAMPQFLSLVVPVGLMGILVAAMLAADMSTQSSYLLAWSSVIYNDILYPWHRNRWSEQKSMLVNRMLVAGIGIFLLLYGLWYPLQGDLWTYMQVTGTIYLSSMSVMLISACYWKKANNWGALAAIITGSVLPVSFLILAQGEATRSITDALGPYKTGIATYVLTAVAMWIGSSLKPQK